LPENITIVNMRITVSTDSKRQVVDITDRISSQIKGNGLINIFVRHTTAAVTCADLDPGTDLDFLDAIETMTPDKRWRHPHDPGHFPDHLWSSVIGQSLTLPVKNDELLLGTWQRIILMEFDGPRKRELELTFIKGGDS
jgi:secondary thiamine-phosphate synthase enzyme